MTNNFRNVSPANLRAYADHLDALQAMEVALFGATIATVPTSAAPAPQQTVRAAGARKSIVHPNAQDLKALDCILAFTDEMFTQDMLVTALNEAGIEIDKKALKPTLDFLKVNYITTHGRGRGAKYSCNVENNNLQVVDTSNLGPAFRQSGGPTVIEIVRAVFNVLEPEQKVSPSQIMKIAMQAFPEKGLQNSSFGQVFTNMATKGEVSVEGKGRSRQYWRIDDKLPGAAEIADDFTIEDIFNDASDTTNAQSDNTTEATETTETSEGSEQTDTATAV